MYKKIHKGKKAKKDEHKEPSQPPTESKGKSKSRPREDELKSIQFASGNSLVEVTNGMIWYFVETVFEKCEEKGHKSELILMLQVPISFTTQELLQFTGPVSQTIEQIRIIRDCKPNQYMALIKFDSQLAADEFFINFNGVRFNSIEPEICKLVYVEKIELINNDDTKSNSDLIKTELSMVGGEQSTCTFCLENMSSSELASNKDAKDGSSKDGSSKDGNNENANVEQSGAILTVLCGHSFHSSCLMKWPDQYCPLCRCSQTPEHVSDNVCQECNMQQDSLWLCITCGHVGCGRYIKGHAYLHYSKTQHNFAMQVGQSNRVWDYAADNYVNRLLQTNDGKPVEVVGNSNDMNEKLEAVQLEYTYLLTNQLESQRNHYEQLLKKVETDAEQAMEETKKKSAEDAEELKRLRSDNERLEKERDKLEKKLNAVEQKYSKCLAELKEEKDLGKCLLDKQKEVTEYYKMIEKKMEEKENEILQLRDEVRDLLFYVEVQNKLNNDESINEEIKEGKISLNDPDLPATASTSHSKRNKNRKK